jgi:hypothetical protein
LYTEQESNQTDPKYFSIIIAPAGAIIIEKYFLWYLLNKVGRSVFLCGAAAQKNTTYPELLR